MHVEPGALKRALGFLGQAGIVEIVNLSGGAPGDGLEESIAEAHDAGHTIVFYNPSFGEAQKGGAYGKRLAKEAERAFALGARGVKISKGLGLGWPDAKDRLLPIDDPGLDPLFEAAGRLAMPVAIHSGDPKAFWQPPTPQNERYQELRVHPRWSFYGAPVSWQDLFSQFEKRVARHPKTIFIGVHFGNDPEDPDEVGRLLDRYPNLYIDTAARIPEIGRRDAHHNADKLRNFFIHYQDRIVFGTDVGIGTGPQALMLGSTGERPPGPADVFQFFDSSWRWFETHDVNIPSPTPVQGRWTIDGIGLPREVLEKVYRTNAEKILPFPDAKPTH